MRRLPWEIIDQGPPPQATKGPADINKFKHAHLAAVEVSRAPSPSARCSRIPTFVLLHGCKIIFMNGDWRDAPLGVGRRLCLFGIRPRRFSWATLIRRSSSVGDLVPRVQSRRWLHYTFSHYARKLVGETVPCAKPLSFKEMIGVFIAWNQC
jgi:hypothetical protein